MKSRVAVLRRTPATWQLTFQDHKDASARTVETLGAEPGQLQQVLAEHPCGAIAFTLPSAWCLLGSGDIYGKTMSAESEVLEHQFPVPKVGLYAFDSDEHLSNLSVGIERCRIDPVLSILSAGAREIALVPEAMLLAASTGHRDRVLIASDNEWADLVLVENGEPRRWGSCPARPAEIGQEADRLLERAIHDDEILVVDGDDASTRESMVSHARQKFASGERFWREMTVAPLRPRRSERERGLKRLAWSAVAALLILAAGLQVAASRTRGAAEALVKEQEAWFGQALPGQPVPVDPILAVESEIKKLQRVVVLGAEDVVPITAQFAACLRALPRDIRLRVDEIRIGGTAFVIEGEAKDQGTVDRIGALLAATKQLSPEAPRTEQRREGTIGFVVAGKGGRP